MAYPTPVVWYKFEQNALDSSGNGNDGTAEANVVYGTSNTGLGYCKGPETADARYITSVDCGIANGSAWTFAAWVWLQAWPGAGEYVWYYGTADTNKAMGVYYTGANSLRALHYAGDTTLEIGGVTGQFPAETWFHIAFTHPGGAVANTKFYYNASLEHTYASGVPDLDYTGHQITANGNDLGREFWGKVDNYMVFDEELNLAQIGEIYALTNTVPAKSSGQRGFTSRSAWRHRNR
jgi:hypothetical protein